MIGLETQIPLLCALKYLSFRVSSIWMFTDDGPHGGADVWTHYENNARVDFFFLVVGSIQKVSSALKWTNTRTHRKSKVFVSRNKNEERKKALLRKDFSLRTAQNSQLPLTRKFI